MDPTLLAQMGNQFQGGLGNLLSGLFIDQSRPYQNAQNTYQSLFPQIMGYLNQGQNYLSGNFGQGLQPYAQAGTNALPQYQNWLNTMQDPTAFINNTMGKYQESPWAKYQQQQAMHAAQNMGSASGLTGSTPLMQQAQQNASNISSQDMNQWLGNILGVNNQYGSGLQNMISGGQNAQNAMSNMQLQQALAQAGLSQSQANMFNQYGQNMSGFDYAKAYGKNQNKDNIFSGLLKLLF